MAWPRAAEGAPACVHTGPRARGGGPLVPHALRRDPLSPSTVPDLPRAPCVRFLGIPEAAEGHALVTEGGQAWRVHKAGTSTYCMHRQTCREPRKGQLF